MKIKNKKQITYIIYTLVAMVALVVTITHRFKNNFDYVFYNEDDIILDCDGQDKRLLSECYLKPGAYTLTAYGNLDAEMQLQVIPVTSYDWQTEEPVKICTTLSRISDDVAVANFTLDQEYHMVNVYSFGDANAQFESFQLRSDTEQYKNTAISKALLISAILTVYIVGIWLIKKEDYSAVLYILSGVLIVIFSSMLYLTGATPVGDDSVFHILRIAGIAENIQHLNIPARINTVFNAGYGYINPVLYPELFLYIPGALVALGMSFLRALEAFYTIVNIITAFSALYAFEKISGSKYIGFICAAIYNLAFYRLENVFVRSAMGEALFMAFLPLAVYGLYTIMYEDHKKWLLFRLSVTRIIQSHIIGSVFTVLFLGIEFVIFSADLLIKKKFDFKIIVQCIKSVVCTVALNLWFFVPFLFFYATQKLKLFDEDYTMRNFIYHLLSLDRMLSITTVKNHIIENISFLVMFAVVLAIIMIILSARSKGDKTGASLAFAVMSFAFFIICSKVFPWEKLADIAIVKSIMLKIQFAFRFYSLMLMSLCICIALAMRSVPHSKYITVLAVVTAITAAYSGVAFSNEADARYPSDPVFYLAPVEYLMEDADFFTDLTDKRVKYSDNIQLEGYTYDYDTLTIQYTKTDDETAWIKLPVFYYYGYRAKDNITGQYIPLVSGENGCLVLNETGGAAYSKIVSVKYDHYRKIYRYPLLLSIVSAVAIAEYCMWENRKQKIK